LTAFLIDVLNLVTGNLDREGGVIFGAAPLYLDEISKLSGLATYGKHHSRIGGYPDVLGTFPAGVMAREITTPGKGQLRALFVSAGNPVNSVPGGLPVEALDLLVCIDLYVSDTARSADYILPATTFLEREDIPLPFLQLHLTPHVAWTEAVVPPRGEARQEWEIIEDLARRMGLGIGAMWPQRLAHRLGLRPTPRFLIDLLLRTGPRGIGRGGLSVRRLRAHPHGITLAEHQRTGTLRKRILHKDKRVHLVPAEIVTELERLGALGADSAEYPLRLIGLRELRSHNSWMHNAPGLMRGKRTHLARINPKDAASYGIGDGDRCVISSAYGSVELPAKVTDEMTQGTIAVPHGWGHDGGWRVATAAGGANVNRLASPEDLEPLAGMAHLNGIPVRVSPS
jgi:formate dehydrogenase